MKTATFENSVSVLVKAYFDDTLQPTNCHKCAVGNLIKDACGLRSVGEFYVDLHNRLSLSWYAALHSVSDRNYQYDYPEPTAAEHPHIQKSGYTAEQLFRIEEVFMRNTVGSDFDMNFNGLLAVVDVLAEIHNVDLSVKERAIGQFQEIHQTKTV